MHISSQRMGRKTLRFMLYLDWKRMLSCSVPTVVGKTVSPLPPCLKEFVQLSEICLEGSGAGLVCNAMDSAVGARVGLDPAASWLLSSAMLKPPRGLCLAEHPEFPALTVSTQHSPTWPFIELSAICLQILIWRDWNGKKCGFGCFLEKRLAWSWRSWYNSFPQTFHFYL